ncbi:MAG: hypothetical protein J3Q66DRAFT_435456 [Benniella sp.]|nr:MAG: hypothetical protein J3Q66DRAFT_435456 [Benniella sp.]
MASRYNTAITPSQPQLEQQQQQQRFPPPNHFQDGHPIQVESPEWSSHQDKATGSVSSVKSWASTSDSQQQPYNTQAFHSGYAPIQNSPLGPLPPRSSSNAFTASRNRSNSNASNLSATMNYGLYNGSNHSSHLSQVSNTSSNNSSYVPQPGMHYQQQQSWQQNFGQEGALAQPSFPYSMHQQGQSVATPQGTTASEGYFVDHHQQQQPYRPPPLDTPGRIYQQEASPSTPFPMQSIEQTMAPQDSPRATQRALQKRRENNNNTQFPSTIDGELPSLDQYEEMLQKMTSPGLGPTRPRRTEQDREARSERIGRHARKMTQQLQQPQPQQLRIDRLQTLEQELQLQSEPMRLESHQEASPTLGNHPSISVEDRKLRRRSSLPSSFGGKNGLERAPSGSSPTQIHANEGTTLLQASINNSAVVENRYSWMDESVALREDLIIHHDRSKMNTGATDENSPLDPESGDSGLSPRNHYPAHSMLTASSPPSSRSRSTTPLGMAATPPNMQHLLASMDEADMSPSPHRSTTPNPSRSRPTTPTLGIRPPPGPAPPSAVSGPINVPNMPRKGSPMGRRVKGGPLSAIISPGGRPRAGSSASVSSMSSITSIAIDSAIQQAPPTLPLPSLPPPPSVSAPLPTIPSTMSSDPATQRRRKASGSKELVIPAPQLVSELQQNQGQDSLLTPVSLPPTSPESSELGLSYPSASSLHSPNHPQSQITRLKKRVSTLQKELETLGKQLSGRIRDGGEQQLKIDQLTLERDTLEKQVALLQDYVPKKDDGQEYDNTDLQTAMQQIQQEKDILMRECIAKHDRQGTDASPDDTAETGRDEGHSNSSLHQELEILRSERDGLQESRAAQDRELELMNGRLQQEEAQYRILQDTVQRLTSKIAQLESNHASEMERLQQDHEEVMEKVVMDHANVLTELTEQQTSQANDSHVRERQAMEEKFAKEHQEWMAADKVFKARLKELAARNDALEAKLYEKEKALLAMEEEEASWRQKHESLERQLAIERLQHQENVYKLEKAEKGSRRLRDLLGDLDLLVSRESESGEDEEQEKKEKEEEELKGPSEREKRMRTTYEAQRQTWLDRIQLLERRAAKSEEENASTLQKNMELMVALELAQSSSSS